MTGTRAAGAWERRRAIAACAIAGVLLLLAAALGLLGYLAWSARPTLARALLFGAPTLSLFALAICVGVEGLAPTASDSPGRDEPDR